MRRALLGTSAFCGAAVLAYGVRGRSAHIFGPSVWRGPSSQRSLALTFDDGPSESTPQLLRVLADAGVPATFFQCGANIRRVPSTAREVLAAGHEIGNHSDTHPAFYFRSEEQIYREFERAQRTVEQVTGFSPALLRAPLGARWFGFRAMQRRLGLLGVMWTTIGRDWRLGSRQVAKRVIQAACNGAIICLHDGRELQPRPDIRVTIDAVREIVPALLHRGYTFRTVSQLLCPTK